MKTQEGVESEICLRATKETVFEGGHLEIQALYLHEKPELVI